MIWFSLLSRCLFALLAGLFWRLNVAFNVRNTRNTWQLSLLSVLKSCGKFKNGDSLCLGSSYWWTLSWYLSYETEIAIGSSLQNLGESKYHRVCFDHFLPAKFVYEKLVDTVYDTIEHVIVYLVGPSNHQISKCTSLQNYTYYSIISKIRYFLINRFLRRNVVESILCDYFLFCKLVNDELRIDNCSNSTIQCSPKKQRFPVVEYCILKHIAGVTCQMFHGCLHLQIPLNIKSNPISSTK